MEGGTAVWAQTTGFPPTFIFPFTDAGNFGMANLYEFQVLMYRPLYWYGTNGQPTVDYNLSLAEAPKWSADGLTATVIIKPYKWSNGETADASNVMFWMHMLEMEKTNYGGYAPGYLPDNLTSYRTLAKNKISFTFDKVYSHNWVLMNQLSLITPMPKAWDRTAAGPSDCTNNRADCPAVYDYLIEQNNDQAHFATSPVWSVVNGPWKLKSYNPGGQVTFVPNEKYSGPNKPHLAEFKEVPFASDENEYNRLRAGAASPDAIQVGHLPFGHTTAPTADPTKGGPNPLSENYTLIPQIVFSIRYFALNFNNPTAAGSIFKQLYFRQALQSTVDQDAAIRDVYKGYGYRTNGPVPALPDSNLISPAQRNDPYPFSIDRAKQLLTAAGWDVSTAPGRCVNPGTGLGQCGAGIAQGDKLSFSMRYASGHPTLTLTMDKLKADAAQTGIEINLSQADGDTLARENTTCTPSPSTPCAWQMIDWNGGWIYGPNFYPTGESLYQTSAGVNFGSYSDPQADALITKTVTSDALSDLYAYQDYVAKQVPVIWMANFPVRLLEVANNLKGVTPINPFGMINPEDWYYVRK
ncbi:MAG: ABC transporter substrate-binding protein [Egibacteraceae bacterium]